MCSKSLKTYLFHPPANDTAYVKKVLDSMRLPGGLVFPMVEDAATALAAVEASRYPPEGIRDGCMVHFENVFTFSDILECEKIMETPS